MSALLVGAMVACPSLALAAEDTPSASTVVATEDKQEPVVVRDEVEVEHLTKAYNRALERAEEARAKVDEIQAQVDEVEAAIPDQQARSQAALKQSYIMKSNPSPFLDSLFSSATLADFIRQGDYLEAASRSNVEQLQRLRDMQAQLDEAKQEQARIQAQVEAEVEKAHQALLAAQGDRESRQRVGQEKAIQEAHAEGGEASVGVAYDGGVQPEDYRIAATEESDPLVDGADWTMDRATFIAAWAPRLDSYLAGTPLAGQGANFAASAWKYNIDPRWSAAISNTESSRARYCIRPFNAWGWGAADSDPYNLAFEWSSWEEAIDAHAKGLSEGYGYTITMSGARKYCPYNWQSWYNNTLGQMQQI